MGNRNRAKRARHIDRTRPGRRCPECGRGMALVLNAFYGVRYCRWAELGMCTLTEYRAVESRPGAIE
jgi:ssDNA-binding Zn-finger/Zn-ribbon topoisomerase 1